jgi:hypothetical protein
LIFDPSKQTFRPACWVEKANYESLEHRTMPIERNELDTIDESKSLLDFMEPGKFYSVSELSGFILEEPLPGTSEEIEAATRGKEGLALVIEAMKIMNDMTYVQSLIAIRVVRGELIRGRKGNNPYYARMTTQ